MADIAIAWDPQNARGDWVLAGGGVALGSDLESAVLVSLFTDRVAPPGYVPTDGSDDPRGWWADSFRDTPIGSLLWLLNRVAIRDRTTIPNRARDYCRQALKWLTDKDIAASVDVRTGWIAPTMLGIQVVIVSPTGARNAFRYGWAWSGLAS